MLHTDMLQEACYRLVFILISDLSSHHFPNHHLSSNFSFDRRIGDHFCDWKRFCSFRFYFSCTFFFLDFLKTNSKALNFNRMFRFCVRASVSELVDLMNTRTGCSTSHSTQMSQRTTKCFQVRHSCIILQCYRQKQRHIGKPFIGIDAHSTGYYLAG